MNQLERDVDVILAELKSILLKKHEDYGPLNIALSPGGPFNGLRVRMYDKLARFSHLYEKDNDTPNYESLKDTFIDLANYAIIGILVQNGQWEGIDNDTTRTDSDSERPSDSVSRHARSKEGNWIHQDVPTNPVVVRR